ncbi:MAG: hypothetical protein WC965_01440 [Thiohalomonadaceae bacterium]
MGIAVKPVNNDLEKLRVALEEYPEDMVYDGNDEFDLVDTVETDSGRWHRYMLAVFRSNETGRYYGFPYSVGLTENQENEYDIGEPEEVAKKTTRMVEIIEWTKV